MEAPSSGGTRLLLEIRKRAVGLPDCKKVSSSHFCLEFTAVSDVRLIAKLAFKASWESVRMDVFHLLMGDGTQLFIPIYLPNSLADVYLDPEYISFSRVRAGTEATAEASVVFSSPEYVWQDVSLQSETPALEMAEFAFQPSRLLLLLKIDTNRLPQMGDFRYSLRFTSSDGGRLGGTLTVPSMNNQA